MAIFSFFTRPQGNWKGFSLEGIKFEVKSHKKDAFPGAPVEIPPYFWNKRRILDRFLGLKPRQPSFPNHTGYREIRDIMGHGTVEDLQMLCNQAQDLVDQIFQGVNEELKASSLGNAELSSQDSSPSLIQLKLSPELESWKIAQHAAGNILPPKGRGLAQASDEVLKTLGATNWHDALKTNNALFGSGFFSLIIGAADAPTLLSNYVVDMAFYYEHGYNHVFPSLETLLENALDDEHAISSPGGRQRRSAARVGKQYIQGKIALEKQHKAQLMNKSARVNRRTAQIISVSESSLLGMAAEMVARGFDTGATMADLIWTSPGTDVIDVGCDIINSEVMNSFLNAADITQSGIVTEDALRKIYDAYAAAGARTLTCRWHEPLAKVCAGLYTWHIENDRHMFIRRALLGWPKARKTPTCPQREADFDEAFDEQHHTTGFSRPLDPEYSCDGKDTCNHVSRLLGSYDEEPLLKEFWWFLVLGPLEYVREGKVNETHEQHLIEGLRLRSVQLLSKGFVAEKSWLIAHASHHAWQVNYLFEAAMFGSILDGGELAGKLDRQEESD